MKKLLLASAATALMAGAASAQDVKLGVLLGFTGPLESITPSMGAGADLAIKEINDSGKFTLGAVSAVRGDFHLHRRCGGHGGCRTSGHG